ncbi:ADP-ribose glycohydrolase MACROD1 isoform X5 [Macaca fascicularis]|uniref:ADP-ribose glycohydrolase MACROD1 isoform X5 n=1 Tax=Macaca fascicularis TaxID=9541 RepID=UPI003D154811
MSLQSRLSGRLVQLRAAGQLLVPPRPRPGHLAGATRTRSSTCCPPAFLGVFGRSARTSAGVGAWGAAAVGRTAGVRTWAPLAMAAKVDLSTSTDWKEAKSFLKGLSDKQREEHYFCKDFVRLKKIPTWKEMAKGVAVKVEEPRYKKDKQLNEKISLFRGDITKLEVDAIVNAESHSQEDPVPTWNPREWRRQGLDTGFPHRARVSFGRPGLWGTPAFKVALALVRPPGSWVALAPTPAPLPTRGQQRSQFPGAHKSACLLVE